MTQVAVKERGMLFSAAMVKALLAGTKTQTRRALKVQPEQQAGGQWRLTVSSTDRASVGKLRYVWPDPAGNVFTDFGRASQSEPIRCPYGQPGDRLWVRESSYQRGKWCYALNTTDEYDEWWQADELAARLYAADGPKPEPEGEYIYRSVPSIHMPRAASRLLLEITAVRCERVQDISESDAVAEGIERHIIPECPGEWGLYRNYLYDGKNGATEAKAKTTAPESYATLWQSINGPDSWAANPWVWAITFAVVK